MISVTVHRMTAAESLELQARGRLLFSGDAGNIGCRRLAFEAFTTHAHMQLSWMQVGVVGL
ncbi:hypothetical protein AYM40_21670 [Paraburkholderia phytofirmans OLGA172]|uniref:Uncharacterized protein n=1 Tax=Paraburkholderia phytofirmans OLGA172 TaxID=1417228 RepID=A0A160FRA3_9BURK|nr:hypothetical protein AYM40_21670 [Paraburkholderia phytofirmans OLGA172]